MSVANIKSKWSSGNLVFYNSATGSTVFTISTSGVSGSLTSPVRYADTNTLSFGTDDDVTMQWDGTNFVISALTDDSLIEIGDAGTTQKSFDVKWYGNGASGADYLYFDASANLVYTTGIDFQFKDNDMLVFGTGAGASGDIQMYWDATNMLMTGTAASSEFMIGTSAHIINVTLAGALTVGENGTGYDVKFYGDTSGKYMLWDESNDKLVIVGSADLGAACEADAYTVGGVAGIDHAGAIATITITKGIVTAVTTP